MPARLVVVTGGKGGPGATTLAVGLAGALAAKGTDVLLADLDPAGGEVAAHLPAEPHRGLLPLLSLTGGPVSPEQVAAESVTVGEHLWVLPGLPRSEPAGGGVLSPAKARAVVLAATRLPELEVVLADAGRLLPRIGRCGPCGGCRPWRPGSPAGLSGRRRSSARAGCGA